VTSLAETGTSDKHCVVRVQGSWFSLPAESVREIGIAPELVAVPQCHRALAGLCHLRSDFIPVIALDALIDVQRDAGTAQPAKLMVIRGRSVWALRIDEAAAIESLETLVAPESRMEDGQPTPVIGTAMFRSHIVRVLDPNTIFELAQSALEDQWRRPDSDPCSDR
jgi:chemotaxis signal transduction protein